jgi:hypothetical protein
LKVREKKDEEIIALSLSKAVVVKERLDDHHPRKYWQGDHLLAEIDNLQEGRTLLVSLKKWKGW